MTNIKKLILATALGCMTSISYAQEYKVYEKDNTLIIQQICDCFPFNIVGMKDNVEQNVARSIKDGAAVQHIIGSDGIKESQIDQKMLVKEMDDFTEHTSKYFKNNPQLKGMFIARFSYYPGYKQAFQFTLTNDMPEDKKKFLNRMNNALKTGVKCDKEGFCSALVQEGFDFVGDKKLNEKEFVDFLQKQPPNNLHVSHKNKSYNKPIFFYIIMGTNGYHVEESDLKDFLTKLQGSKK